MAVGCRSTKKARKRLSESAKPKECRRLPLHKIFAASVTFLYLGSFHSFNERELDVLSDPQTICRHEQVRPAEGGTHTSTFFRRLGRTAAAGGVPNNNNHYNKTKSNGSAAFFFLLPLLMMTADGEKKTAEFDSFVARGERATAATTDHKSADFFFGWPFFPLTGRLGT